MESYQPDRPANDGDRFNIPVTSRDFLVGSKSLKGQPELNEIKFDKLPELKLEEVEHGIQSCFMDAFSVGVIVEMILTSNDRKAGSRFLFEVQPMDRPPQLTELLGDKPVFKVSVLPYRDTYRIYSQDRKFVIGELDPLTNHFFFDPKLNEGAQSK
jgi:hypothetical protein